MRKERIAAVDDVTQQLHTVENAMHVLMTENAKLGVSILAARAQARISPLVGGDVLSEHATSQQALSQFMGSMVRCHSGLRDIGGELLPSVAIGDTPRRYIDTEQPEERGPRLVASS